jgi:hypothetical protein
MHSALVVRRRITQSTNKPKRKESREVGGLKPERWGDFKREEACISVMLTRSRKK